MASNLQRGSGGLKCLYVGCLHFSITEDKLQGIFEPFGKVNQWLSALLPWVCGSCHFLLHIYCATACLPYCGPSYPEGMDIDSWRNWEEELLPRSFGNGFC